MEVSPEQEPLALAPAPPSTVTPHGLEDADLSWEDKEDKDKKLDAEKTQPLSPKSAADKKYQYKEGRCGPRPLTVPLITAERWFHNPCTSSGMVQVCYSWFVPDIGLV